MSTRLTSQISVTRPAREAMRPRSPDAAWAGVATVERGRVASLAGIVTLMWLVILVLMIWNS